LFTFVRSFAVTGLPYLDYPHRSDYVTFALPGCTTTVGYAAFHLLPAFCLDAPFLPFSRRSFVLVVTPSDVFMRLFTFVTCVLVPVLTCVPRYRVPFVLRLPLTVYCLPRYVLPPFVLRVVRRTVCSRRSYRDLLYPLTFIPFTRFAVPYTPFHCCYRFCVRWFYSTRCPDYICRLTVCYCLLRLYGLVTAATRCRFTRLTFTFRYVLPLRLVICRSC